MAIEAELHDGTILEFPDETAPDVIQRTVKRQLGLVPATEPPPSTDEIAAASEPARQIRPLRREQQPTATATSAPPAFDPEGADYDIDSAKKAGLTPDETGHWPSRVPDTGLILKGRGHETFSKTEEGERAAGMEIYKGDGGRYYSRPIAQPKPTLPPARMTLSRGGQPEVVNPIEYPTVTSTGVMALEPQNPPAPAPQTLIEQRGAPVTAETFQAEAQRQASGTPEQAAAAREQPGYAGSVAKSATRALEQGARTDFRRRELVRSGAAPQTAENIVGTETAFGVEPKAPQFADQAPGTEYMPAPTEEDAARKEWWSKRSSGVRGITKGVLNIAAQSQGLADAAYEAMGMPSPSAKQNYGALKNFQDSIIGATSADGGRHLEGILESTITQVPWLALGIARGAATIPLLAMGLGQFGDTYSESRAAGVDVNTARIKGGIFAAAEVLGEMVSMPFLIAGWKEALKGIPPEHLKARGIEFLAGLLAREIPGELGTTTAEFIADKWGPGGLHPEWTARDYAQQIVDTIIQTAGQVGLMGAASSMAGGFIGKRPAGEQIGRALQEDVNAVPPAPGAAEAEAIRRLTLDPARAAAARATVDRLEAQAALAGGAPVAPPGGPAPGTAGDLKRAMGEPGKPLAETRQEDAQVALEKAQSEESAAEAERLRVEAEVDAQFAKEEAEAGAGIEQPAAIIAPEGDGTPASPIIAATPEDVAAAAAKTNPEPTPAQIEAENFAKGRFQFADQLKAKLGVIAIETAKGGTRTAKDGSWSVPDFPATYGHLPTAMGNDGDKADIFIGDALDSPVAFVIDQVNLPDRSYDETKSFVGFASKEAAIDAYVRGFSDGKGLERIGAITEMPIAQFVNRARADNLKKAVAYVKLKGEPSETDAARDAAEGNAPEEDAATGDEKENADDGRDERYGQPPSDQPVPREAEGQKPAVPAEAVAPGVIERIPGDNGMEAVLVRTEKGQFRVALRDIEADQTAGFSRDYPSLGMARIAAKQLLAGKVEPQAKPRKGKPSFRIEGDMVPPEVRGEAPAALTAEQQADADIAAALGELGDLLGKSARLNITPEQEQKLFPILTKLFDAAFRKGYIKFKQAARFVRETITKALGQDVADQLTLDHYQGAYISMAGRYRDQGAENAAAVAAVQSLEEGQTDELQASIGGPEQQQEPAAAPGAAKGGETGPIPEPGGEGVEGAGGPAVPADIGAGQGEGTKPATKGKPRPKRSEGTGAAGAERPSLNYRITAEDKIGQSGWRQKALDNVAAIKIIKAIEKDNRQATPEEKKKLVKWVGWGASELANGMFPRMEYNYNTRKSEEVYKDGWESLAKELRAILTDEEYEAARESTQNAHYTSPAIIQGIYSGLKHIGFRGGRMLEPGSGPGHFIGLQPADLSGKIQFTGVELDPITAKVAKALYPESRIENVDFTEFKRPDGFFDGTVGNPPFASTIITSDEKYAKFKFSLHDYFVAKAVDLTAPGGPIVLITSRYTMDKVDDKARAYLMTKADLIGAIRLPQTAFKQNAGTEVVTDVLFFRKRKDGELASGPAWRELKEVKTKQGMVKINEYFADNPDMVLGKHALTGSMYGKNEYTVEPSGNIEEQFLKAALKLPADIIAPPAKAETSEPDIAPNELTENSFYYTDNKVLQKRNGIGVDAGLSAVEKNKVRGLILIRQAVLQTIKAQLDGQDATEHRKTLNSVYDYFVKTYGPINKEVVSTRRITKGKYAGQESVSVKTPNFDAFKSDPHAYRVASIENYDPETGKATKREIFTQDVINPYVEPKIENAVDALHVTVHQLGKVDIDAVAEAAGVPVPVAIDTLADAIYMNPETKDWELAETYLAGAVRKKLKFAQAASMEDPSLARNVRALEAVQPDDLPAARIHLSLGSPLIDTAYVSQFASEALGLERVRVEHIKKAALWLVTAPDNVAESERAISDWGIPDRNAVELLSDALNSKGVRIYQTVVEKGVRKQVYDPVATQAALEKLSKIKAAFESWWREDDARATAIARIYNDTNNDYVKPDYAGPHIDKLEFPGIATTKVPYKHQKRAAWRIVSAGNTYLAHSVGSGKTLASILAGAMLKRLGLKKKIMYVVHNATLRQFASEWLEAYPAAKVLVADDENFSKEERNRFMGRIAAENWDAIIITQSAFKMIPVSPEQTEKFITGELDEMRLALSAAEGDRGRTKAIERVIKSLEQKLDKMMSQQGKDKGVTFEESGVDQLFVDEAHAFRKLDFGTNQINVKGINPVGSQQAVDLFVKVRYLESKSPGRSTVLMSGTPLTNTIGEIFNIQRVLQLPELEARGMHKFDAWSSSFGSMVTELEAQPSGAYKNVTRFGRFKNMRDLSRMWSAVGDVVHTRDLPYLNLPKVKGGGRQVVLGESTQVLKDYKKELDKRIKDIEARKRPPKKGDDIILSVITDGRHAALDERYIDKNIVPNPESKLEKAIANVAQIYKDTESVKGTQMVFADLGMPGSETVRGFSVYNRVRQGLIEKGIPADQIVFAQDFKTPDEKRRIFARMNAGEVRVMIGSSDAMGTGVNAQQRIVWMHHLDADKYLPSNIEQREGRGIRQGNELGVIDGVGISVYITKGSYDEKMWQFIESKQRAIDQFLAGDLADDSMDDIDGAANQFAELKAMSSDNPLAMEKAGLDAEVSKLENLYWAHRGDQSRHKATIAEVKEDQPKVEKLIGKLKAAVETTPDLSADKFVIDIGGKPYTSREEAGKAIFAKMREVGDALMAKYKAAPESDQKKTVWGKIVAIGSIGGQQLSLRTDIAMRGEWTPGGYVKTPDVELRILRADPVEYLYMDRTYVGYVPPLESIYLSALSASSESGLVTRIVNNRTAYAQRLKQSEEFLAKLVNRGKQAEERIGAPFIHEAALNEKRQRLEEVERELMAEEQTETATAAEQSVEDDVPTNRVANRFAAIDTGEEGNVQPEAPAARDIDIAEDPLELADGLPTDWIRVGDTIEFRRPLDRLLKTRPATGTGVVESIDESEDGDTYITTEDGEAVRLADATLLPVDEDTRKENLDRLDRAKEAAGDKFSGPGTAFSDRYLANQDAIAEGVIALAKQIAPQANVEIVDQLFRASTRDEVAGRRRASENLIQVALRYEDPERTLRHEAVHSFFDMGLLTGAEQRVLKAKAKEWREKYGIDARYPNLAGKETDLDEEGMADAYGAYRGGEKFGGFIGSAFAKISRFLQRLGNFLRGMGFHTVEDVFARMESGEVGRREQGEATLPMMLRRQAYSDGGVESPGRRRFVMGVAAALATGNVDAGVTLGKARAVSDAIMGQTVDPAVAKILRGNGATNVDGAKALRAAMAAIVKSGPAEVRALAAEIEKLLPAEGIWLTVDTKRRVNAHGVVILEPFPHLTLFTAEGRNGLTYGTVLHETLHAVIAARYRTLSVGMVRSNDSVLKIAAPAASAEMEQLRQLWYEFKAIAKEDKGADDGTQLSVLQAAGSPDEFFVRSLTDPKLQAYMASKEYKGKTLFDRFKDWVKSILGFFKSGTAPSWLDAALAASSDFSTAMVKDSGDFSRLREMNRISGGEAMKSAVYSRASMPDEEAPTEKEPITTRVHGVEDVVLDRERLTPERTQGSIDHAKRIFDEVGLDVVPRGEGLWDVANKGADQDEAGYRLLEALRRELRNQNAGPESPEIASLLTSVAEYVASGDNVGMSAPLRIKLYGVAQGERSHRGLLLGALAQVSPESLNRLARNVEGALERVYGQSFDINAEVVQSTLDDVMRRLRDQFSDDDLAKIAEASPELLKLIDKLAAQPALKDIGGRLYRKVQFLFKEKKEKTIESMAEDARINEAVQKIIEDLKQFGIEPKEQPGKKALTAIERLMVMVNPETSEMIDERIAQAIVEAERNAGIAATMAEASPDERDLMREAFRNGLEPSPEMVEKGMQADDFRHWRMLRDNLLGYSPTTLKLVQQVVQGTFKGTKYGQKAPKPVDVRIDINKLARSPAKEVQRALDAAMGAIEAEMLLAGATPETMLRVSAMLQGQIVAQLEAARARVRDQAFAAPAAKPGQPLTPDQRLRELFNAGLLKDPRLDNAVAAIAKKSTVRRLMPNLGEMVKKVFATRFYRQSELQNRFGRALSFTFGLTEPERKNAEKLFAKAFADQFATAKAKALDTVHKSLTPKQQQTVRKVRKLWETIERAVNAGAFDSAFIMQEVALSRGWTVPTDAQLAEIRDLANREQELRELTDGERATAEREGNVAEAEQEKAAATLSERARLKREMQALWLRWTAPMGWKTAEGRRNVARAVNEITSANLLLRPGFFARQIIDVATQTAVYTPTRAVGEAIIRYRNDKTIAGRQTRLWRDVGDALKDAYGQRRKALRAALSSAKRGLAGRSETKNVEQILDNISIFDRAELKADELAAEGKTGQAFLIRMANYFSFAFRYAKALDELQGVLAEAQDMQARTITELRERGVTPEEASERAAWVMGDTKAEFQLALARTQQMFDAAGLASTPAKLEQSAWDVVKARQYGRIGALKLDAENFKEQNRWQRNVIGWNEREIGGFGGVIAGFGRSITTLAEQIGLPMPLARFSNAIGISINRALTFTPLGFFQQAFKDSAWYEGERNATQRKIEAAAGTSVGLMMMMLVASGVLIPRFKWPEDEAEREIWRKLGRQPGTVEILTGGGKYITISLTVGPLSLVRPYLVFMGSIMESLAKHGKKAEKLARKAEEAGLQPAMAEQRQMDILYAAALAAYSTFLGGRTAVGIISNLTDYRAPQPGRVAAGLVSPLVPGAPQWQELSRMQGVQLDAKRASVLDFMFPTGGTAAEKRNFFYDPLNDQTTERIVKVLTGGTWPLATLPIHKDTEKAYRVLYETGWRPPGVQNQAREIGDQYRAFDSDELEKYRELRGRYLKKGVADANLAGLTENEKLEELDAVAQEANQDAIDDVIDMIEARTGGSGASPKIPALKPRTAPMEIRP